ncbi:Thymidine kinase, cytosolic [Aphelenchoides fujianensis]|nr:Thymidine kinase, cytosolic [Aphelenchoides fujianensis]
MDCQCNSRGSINLIVGPMFSGKTTELLRLCRRHTLAKRKVVVVKYKKDTRYEDVMVSTHDSLKMEGLQALKLEGVGQFFEDMVEGAEKLANEGKTVIVAALDGDYQRKQFETIAKLVPLAEGGENHARLPILRPLRLVHVADDHVRSAGVDRPGGAEESGRPPAARRSAPRRPNCRTTSGT